MEDTSVNIWNLEKQFKQKLSVAGCLDCLQIQGSRCGLESDNQSADALLVPEEFGVNF